MQQHATQLSLQSCTCMLSANDQPCGYGHLSYSFIGFLPRDAMHSAVMRLHVVCPSVTFRYRDHIGCNSSKIISRPNSLRPMRSLTPSGATGTPPKLGLNRVGSGAHKSCQISERVQDRSKVTITD